MFGKNLIQDQFDKIEDLRQHVDKAEAGFKKRPASKVIKPAFMHHYSGNT
jgi:hypothetical protein